MRNWDSDSPAGSISQPSSKPSTQKLSETDTITMALDLATSTDLEPSQANNSDKEKDLGSLASLPTTLTAPTPPAPFTDAATKKLLRKLDLHLIPFLALLYL
jgi:hypothetical protein